MPCCPLEVVKLSVDDALPAPGDTESGENEHFVAAGSPPQLRVTESAKLPPSAVITVL